MRSPRRLFRAAFWGAYLLSITFIVMLVAPPALLEDRHALARTVVISLFIGAAVALIALLWYSHTRNRTK